MGRLPEYEVHADGGEVELADKFGRGGVSGGTWDRGGG